MSEDKSMMGWYPHSGKCDFADHLAIFSDGNPTDEFFKKTKIYFGNAGPLRIDTFTDAIPYFPYLINTATGSEGNHNIYLGTTSYIDQEESEHRGWYEKDVLAYLKKCKKAKTEPSYEDFKEKYWISECFQIREIYKRITENPKDYDLSDIHFNLQQWYRKELLMYAEQKGCDMSHPIFWDHRWNINEYNKLHKEYFPDEEEKEE